MKMEPEIISREHIKPSSPTPDHHRTHKLSLMDQIVPPIYVPLVLYYPAEGEDNVIPKNHIDDEFISQTTQTLKISLSKTLTRFYPFAGRVKDRLSVDCNDEGVLFVVARFTGVRLLEFLKNPDPIACRAHIPSELKWDEPGPGSYVTMIQVNYFDCGGVAVGSLFLHKVADGVTICTFMKAWGAATRSSSDDQEKKFWPDYMAKTFFPQNESMQRDSHLFSAMRRYFKFGKTVMRRYVFDAPAIATLRDKLAASSGGLEFRPSRVEIVSALLWKCFIIAAVKSGSDKNLSLVTHGVNMRRKVEPTFPETSFGNFVWLVPASSNNESIPEQLKDLVAKVRNAIVKVDEDFVRRMQGKEGFSGYSKNLEDSWSQFPEEADYLAISSWCNFGLYSIDFGWGRPAWISKCDGGSDVAWPFINVLWLMDTRKGDGIEAWLTLDEHYIGAFDDIQELKDLATIDPSPCGNDMDYGGGVLIN